MLERYLGQRGSVKPHTRSLSDVFTIITASHSIYDVWSGKSIGTTLAGTRTRGSILRDIDLCAAQVVDQCIAILGI